MVTIFIGFKAAVIFEQILPYTIVHIKVSLFCAYVLLPIDILIAN
jgi:hypothetical protein